MWRYNFNASTRTALTVMPIFYAGYLNVELHMHACMDAAKPEYVAIEEDEDSDYLPHVREEMARSRAKRAAA
ncbi:hypothetical protein HYH03_009197 [Edaphochlamys debaryana]|uniref:Uncharacterized protein n=1 Tax=Edaphochlamys debaryana TaxID=47281 RepID=A0A835XZL7_9CHLO|nr:hypothetical protein HYH03_009197 [Edaphochlamys debaryana]|eukprot:KAG2492532.1 hypothetical protein HYH03_009197 [Edaphochlamys debaryana]